MADSSQKILKELSDVTRNLDVLAKEIRAMNKNTASVQDAVIKSVEKKEATDNKIDKSPAQNAERVISETKKKQDGMFTKFLETIKKNSEAGNNEIKRAGLEGIKNAGKTLLETKSLKSAAKSGLGSILNSSKDSIVESIRRKREEKNSAKVEGITSTEGLKEKEKIKKEEEVAKESVEKKVKDLEKKDKKSILEKLKIKKDTKEEKSEKKEFLDKLKKKVSNKEPKKNETLTDLAKEKNNPEDSSAVKSQEKKDLPSLKSLTPGIAPERNQEEKFNLKERSKQIFQKTTLGSTIKSFSDAIKNRKLENTSSPSSIQNKPEKLSIQSKIEKIGTELKSKIRSKKKESPSKEKSEIVMEKETTAPTNENKTKGSNESEKTSTYKTDDKNKKSDKDKSSEISAQDITDIKNLLASINTTLNGPLNVKDSKPYRPHSNMLE